MTEYKKFTVRIPEQFIDFTIPVYEGETIESPLVRFDVFEQAGEVFVEADFEVYDEHGFRYPDNLKDSSDVVEAVETFSLDEAPASEGGTRGPGTNPGV